MQVTLATLLADAVKRMPAGFLQAGGGQEVPSDEFLQWIADFPAQTVLLAMGVLWSSAVDAALRRGDEGGAMDAPLGSLRQVLGLLADQVLRRLDPRLRKKYEQLITELVYNRDVTQELKDAGVSTADSFQWLCVAPSPTL